MVNSITGLQRDFIETIGESVCPNLPPMAVNFNVKEWIAILVHRALPIPTTIRANELRLKAADGILWFRTFHTPTIPPFTRNVKYIGKWLMEAVNA